MYLQGRECLPAPPLPPCLPAFQDRRGKGGTAQNCLNQVRGYCRQPPSPGGCLSKSPPPKCLREGGSVGEGRQAHHCPCLSAQTLGDGSGEGNAPLHPKLQRSVCFSALFQVRPLAGNNRKKKFTTKVTTTMKGNVYNSGAWRRDGTSSPYHTRCSEQFGSRE